MLSCNVLSVLHHIGFMGNNQVVLVYCIDYVIPLLPPTDVMVQHHYSIQLVLNATAPSHL